MLPACREERVKDLLEEYGSNPEEFNINAIAAELKHLISEQLAEERRMESLAR